MAEALVEAIDAAIAKANPPNAGRTYLGASQIGDECARKLWYSFHWTALIHFPARILRLFQRGHNEEHQINKYLRDAGIDVYEVDEETGAQFGFKFAFGHGGGHMDAALNNLPDSKEWHVGEYKTSSTKYFKDMTEKGVEKSKPVHYAQMQLYMHLSGMNQAAYLMVNKDDDDIYFERVPYNKSEAERLIAKAEFIVESATPPTRMSEDSTFWKCRFCDYRELCHYDATPLMNCRTCAHSTAETDGDGRWSCAEHGWDLNTKQQRDGCEDHRYIPDLLGNWAELTDPGEGNPRYKNLRSGNEFVNGNGGYASAEIAAVQDIKFIGDAAADKLKVKMNATVTG